MVSFGIDISSPDFEEGKHMIERSSAQLLAFVKDIDGIREEDILTSHCSRALYV